MTLSEVIRVLKELPQDGIVKHGFGKGDSYRGDYSDLAFKPEENVTIGSMTGHASDALGATFIGYKGGSYTMKVYTDCFIAKYGELGDPIYPTLFGLWRREIEGDVSDRAEVARLKGALEKCKIWAESIGRGDENETQVINLSNLIWQTCDKALDKKKDK